MIAMKILTWLLTLQYKVGQTRRPKMCKLPGGLSNEQENFDEIFTKNTT